jgi:dTDP-glucose 4,6-dehydratase
MGWAPKVDFDEGLASTVEWYRERRDWWEPIKSGEYADWYSKNYTSR